MMPEWLEQFTQLEKHPNTYAHLNVDVTEQQAIAEYIKSKQGILLTEWIAPNNASGQTNWYVLYYYQSRWVCLESSLHRKRPALIDLSAVFPVANRLQRSIYDLTKVPTKRFHDKRPWLSHGHFLTGQLNPNATSKHYAKPLYTFTKVSGSGVHEIPIGPVHAGVIEPGHFRLSVIGERILKLEERLGYAHKGIHHLLLKKTINDGAKLISRVSGDSTVAYAYAYALACENLLGKKIDLKTETMRAILLERERIINHIGDIGAIINDTGFAALAMQFLILKEKLLRENSSFTGHRYIMDVIVPTQPITKNKDLSKTLLTNLITLEQQLIELHTIYLQHHGLQDRLKTTGIVNRDTAQTLGLLGVAAKASNVAIDVRAANNNFPYNKVNFTPIIDTTNDVAARVNVRFHECLQSINMIRQFLIMENQPSLQKYSKLDEKNDFGIGCVEGWRGPVCVIVKLNAGLIEWCHFHDPSWQNWLALEYALLENIVADFPLINKSFNLSYSGQDS